MTRLIPLLVASIALACALPALADEPGAYTAQKAPVTGEEVYHQICQSCHMAGALGATGAATIPALAHNPRLATPEFVVVTVLKGRGAMPWFDDMLDPAQIAAVATYVRTHFGNAYPVPVTVAQVKALAGK
jgi:mono/diheme cytochrome c family protein